MSEEDMKAGFIMGGAAALAETLRNDHAWNGKAVLAAPIAVLEAGAIVDTYWSVLGELKNLSFGANLLWPKGSKDVKVAVKLKALSMFDFKRGNISVWRDREELDVVFSTGEGDEVSYGNLVQKFGAMEFSLRLLVVPTSHQGASVWVGASPYSKAELKTRLGGESGSRTAPHITLAIHEAVPHGVKTVARAVHAVFSRQEQRGDGFGFGVIPWLECSADGEEGAILPTSDEFKEATLLFLRQSSAGAVATTPQSIEARMEALVAGKAVAPKNYAEVFPEFCESAGAGENQSGWSYGNCCWKYI